MEAFVRRKVREGEGREGVWDANREGIRVTVLWKTGEVL